MLSILALRWLRYCIDRGGGDIDVITRSEEMYQYHISNNIGNINIWIWYYCHIDINGLYWYPQQISEQVWYCNNSTIWWKHDKFVKTEQKYIPPSHWRAAEESLPLENYTPYLKKWNQIKTTICKKQTKCNWTKRKQLITLT